MPGPYNFYWNSFPSKILDVSDAFTVVRDAWRGETVDEEQAGLAAFNVAGLGYKLGFLGDSPPIMESTATKPTKPQIEAAFAAVIPTPGVMEAPDAKAIPWAILWPIALEFIKRFLKF